MEATDILNRSFTQKRWSLKKVDDEKVLSLKEGLKIHPALCRLLVLRGVDTYEKAKDFFRPSLDHLHDPFLMKGMATAVARISEAVEWHERIMIYGDYDVDGTTAVAVVYAFLERNTDAKLEYYIPHRYREGYGLSKAGIDYAKNNGYSLIITLDCGIKSKELVAYAKTLGIDVIICDHHLPDDELPQAIAILNPKQHDCPYPYKELSGCGIGYKLICALALKWNLPFEKANEHLDLVATSIAADIVAMDGENRVLAFYGMKKANENPTLAIAALKEITGMKRELHVSDLVFVIAPRVNAAGRMDDAKRAVAMFVSRDAEEVKKIVEELHASNFERKELDKNITIEALQMLHSDPKNPFKNTTVLFQHHWHKGVVGIVASRLIDYYHRPTVILTESSEGIISGSARSVAGFNIYEALHECSDLLENYGGHLFAAGMTLQLKNLNEFTQRFESIVSRSITPQHLIPEVSIDCEIKLKDITTAFYNIVKQFEPFGPTNLRPVFLSKNVYSFKQLSRVVKDSHIKFVVVQNDGVVLDGIGFGLSKKFDIVSNGPFDIVYTIDENEFQGNTRLQIKVLDVKKSV